MKSLVTLAKLQFLVTRCRVIIIDKVVGVVSCGGSTVDTFRTLHGRRIMPTSVKINNSRNNSKFMKLQSR